MQLSNILKDISMLFSNFDELNEYVKNYIPEAKKIKFNSEQYVSGQILYNKCDIQDAIEILAKAVDIILNEGELSSSWNNIINKPFGNIGETLIISNDTLNIKDGLYSLKQHLHSYNDLNDKPIIDVTKAYVDDLYEIVDTASVKAINYNDTILEFDSDVLNRLNTIEERKANKKHTHYKMDIVDFPALSNVALSGSYNDLLDRPIIDVDKNYVDIKNNETLDASKQYTDSEINKINNLTVEVVISLPLIGEVNKVYLIKNLNSEDNLYTEYVWINSKWEIWGSASIDLSPYATKLDLNLKANTSYVNSELTKKSNVHEHPYRQNTWLPPNDHNHDNKTIIDSIDETKINEWNNKSSIDHNHTPSSIFYNNSMYPDMVTLADALDKLLYVMIRIDTFISNPNGTTYEIGSVVSAPITFSWTYNKPIISQTCNDLIIPSVDTRSSVYNTNIASNKSFTLVANDGTNNISKIVNFNFSHKRYWDSKPIPQIYDSAFILSLINKEFASSKIKSSFTQTINPNQYFFYAQPSSWGSCIFNVGGFDGGVSKIATIEFTNSSGNIASFDIYKSDNPNLGTQTFTIR